MRLHAGFKVVARCCACKGWEGYVLGTGLRGSGISRREEEDGELQPRAGHLLVVRAERLPDQRVEHLVEGERRHDQDMLTTMSESDAAARYSSPEYGRSKKTPGSSRW